MLAREAEAAFAGGRFSDASALCERLLAFPLREEARRLTLERLLDASLELGRPEAAVKAFTAFAEAGGSPPPDRLRRVAAAHSGAGQSEIALGLFQRSAGALARELTETALILGESAGEAGRVFGVPSLSFLLPDGPDLETMAFERAAALRAPGKKADLEACAVAHLRFAAEFPGSPRKEESWALGLRALLDAGTWAPCARESGRHRRMFPQGRRLDEAVYYEACALMASGKVEEARAAAENLLSREFAKPDGLAGPSRFLHNAEHLLGQVLEVRGDLEGAQEQYGKAADFIEDARRALERLHETRLEAEGIVALRPGQDGGVPVSYRNAASVAVRIYPVDLELYFALHKGMGRADRMALAGVTPSVRFEWTPEGGADRGLHRGDLPLPRLGTGAYFVVLNAGAREASALVIVSELRLFLSRTGGQARIEVRDGDGKPVWGARVLLGDGSRLASSGYTDPRGFFEGDGEEGCWVLASEGGRYALGRLK